MQPKEGQPVPIMEYTGWVTDDMLVSNYSIEDLLPIWPAPAGAYIPEGLSMGSARR